MLFLKQMSVQQIKNGKTHSNVYKKMEIRLEIMNSTIQRKYILFNNRLKQDFYASHNLMAFIIITLL